MSVELTSLILFAALFLAMAFGVPFPFVTGGVAVVFTYLLWGSEALYLPAMQAFMTSTQITLLPLPLFILMANIMERSGVAEDLYSTLHEWFGSLRGGLAIGTIGLGTLFAAMAGGSMAGTLAMGLIALPAMSKRGYDSRLAIGAIQASGPLGVIIPPSNMMILFAWMGQMSLGQLFMAGIVPGLLMAAHYVIYILIRCHFRPDLAPPLPPEERLGWREKFIALKGVVLPLLIIAGVLGSIFFGFASPSEAGAVGVFGAIVSSIIYRQFSWKVICEAAQRTLMLTGMLLWLAIGAFTFVTLYYSLGADELVMNLVSGLDMGRWGFLFIILGILFILGCVLDPSTIIILSVPIILPVIKQLGFDPVWFAILFVITMEISYTTPPIGRNLFTMKAIVPPEISFADIIRACIPFVILDTLVLIWIIAFPQLALWIPRMMIR